MKMSFLFYLVLFVGFFPRLSRADVSLESLNSAFDVVTYAQSSEKELTVLGNKVQEFVSNPKNIKKFKTPE